MGKSPAIDPDIVHQIVVEDRRIENPYSDLETLVTKLEDIKAHLVTVAEHENKLMTYIETAHEAGIFTARQSRVLGVLGLHEDERGNPPLSAVVVQSTEDPTVGDKYFNMVKLAQGLTDTIPGSEPKRRELWEEHLQQVRTHWRNQ